MHKLKYYNVIFCDTSTSGEFHYFFIHKPVSSMYEHLSESTILSWPRKPCIINSREQWNDAWSHPWVYATPPFISHHDCIFIFHHITRCGWNLCKTRIQHIYCVLMTLLYHLLAPKEFFVFFYLSSSSKLILCPFIVINIVEILGLSCG